MKTIKITEEAWQKISLYKAYNRQKTFSEAIKSAIFLANVSHLPIGEQKNEKK